MKGVSLLPSRAGRTLNSACLTGGCGGQLLRGMPAVATGCCHGRGRRGEACMSLPQACNGDGRGRIVRPVRAAEGRRTACPRPRLANWKAGRPADGLSTHVGPLFGPPLHLPAGPGEPAPGSLLATPEGSAESFRRPITVLDHSDRRCKEAEGGELRNDVGSVPGGP